MWGSKRVAKFVGVKYATLDHWIRSGLLSCNSPNDGTGNPRSWSAADVARAAVVGELRRHGYSLQAVRGSGILGRLTDRDIVNGVIVCAVGNVIGVVPEFDPGLKWKECVDCDGQSPPVTVAKFMLDNLSRALPLDQQASVIVYVTDIYESVKQQMKEEREVRDET